MDKVSENYIKSALSAFVEGGNGARRKALVKAGKELALLIVWMKYKGVELQGNLVGRIKALLKSAPDAQKEAIGFYNALQDAPAITGALLKGFDMMIYQGELYIRFNWKDVDTSIVQEVAATLRERGKE